MKIKNRATGGRETPFDIYMPGGGLSERTSGAGIIHKWTGITYSIDLWKKPSFRYFKGFNSCFKKLLRRKLIEVVQLVTSTLISFSLVCHLRTSVATPEENCLFVFAKVYGGVLSNKTLFGTPPPGLLANK